MFLAKADCIVCVLTGNVKSATEIFACVKYVLADNVAAAEHPVGILTSQHRDTWTSNRRKLEQAGMSYFITCLTLAPTICTLDS